MHALLAFLAAGVGLRVAEGAAGPLVLVHNPVPDHVEAALGFQPPATPSLRRRVGIALQVHAGHIPAEGQEVHLRIAAADPVQLPCIVEGGVQDIAHEAGVPLGAPDPHPVPGHVLVHAAHAPRLLLVQLQQARQADLASRPCRACRTTAQPHRLYAGGVGADGDHTAVTPSAHDYLLTLIHFVIERTPLHFLQFFGIFKGAALCPILTHSSCGFNPPSPQNGHQFDTCEHLVDKDVVGQPAALLQRICEPQHHAGAQVQATTRPGEQRAL